MKRRVSFGVGLLVAGVIAPRAGWAQDDQLLQQQLLQQQAQQQTLLMQQQMQEQIQQSQQQMQHDMDEQIQRQQSQNTVVIPQHLQVGSQSFDASVAGFQTYLETIKSTEPDVYRQLAPEAARLESREDAAKAIAAVGFVAGLASVIYGVASENNCTEPAVTDPNFGADAQAWGACNEGNVERLTAFGLLGVGAVIVGGAIAYAKWPSHQDLMDLVNKNNRLSKQPMEWQVGYDPAQRFAFGGATVSF